MKPNNRLFFISILITAVFMFSFVWMNMKGMAGFIDSSDETTTQSLEEALRKAAIQCYALEGGYPPSVYYLRDNYGIMLNEKDYFYHYEVMASNIMPDIKVIKK